MLGKTDDVRTSTTDILGSQISPRAPLSAQVSETKIAGDLTYIVLYTQQVDWHPVENKEAGHGGDLFVTGGTNSI